MKQITLATAGFERYDKTTGGRKDDGRATFLAEMESWVPWRRLCPVEGVAGADQKTAPGHHGT